MTFTYVGLESTFGDVNGDCATQSTCKQKQSILKLTIIHIHESLYSDGTLVWSRAAEK